MQGGDSPFDPQRRSIHVIRHHGVRLAQAWFEQPLQRVEDADVVHITRSPVPLPRGTSGVSQTLITELSEGRETIWGRFTKEVRYEIRRAETKDEVVCTVCQPATVRDLAEFLEFYSAFASEKGLAGLSGTAAGFLTSYVAGGRLVLSRAERGGETLVWHAHYAGDTRCRLLFSASHFRSAAVPQDRALIGRANRLLHWIDVVGFSDDRYGVYDWGGWHPGCDDALQRINKFKEGFGGQVTTVYDARYGLTFCGVVENAITSWVNRHRHH